MNGWVAFERPTALLLLAALPALGALYALAFVARRRALHAFAGSSSSLASGSVFWQITRGLLRLAGLAALVLAVAGPRVGQPVERRDVVVLLDVSPSMATQDLAPSRLALARDVIDRLAADLREQRIGLVYFAGDARLRFPLTPDTEAIGKVLQLGGYPFTPATGTSVDAGLRAALELLPPEVRANGRPKSLVLVSDGDGAGNSSFISALRSEDVRLFAVGIGTAAGGQVPLYGADGRFLRYLAGREGPTVSSLDAAGLEALAQATGGRYWTYTGSEPVPEELSAQILLMPPTEVIGERWVLDYERRWLLLATALGILLLEAWLPERRRMPVPAIPR